MQKLQDHKGGSIRAHTSGKEQDIPTLSEEDGNNDAGALPVLLCTAEGLLPALEERTTDTLPSKVSAMKALAGIIPKEWDSILVSFV
jgi:hypothetical protein